MQHHYGSRRHETASSWAPAALWLSTIAPVNRVCSRERVQRRRNAPRCDSCRTVGGGRASVFAVALVNRACARAARKASLRSFLKNSCCSKNDSNALAIAIALSTTHALGQCMRATTARCVVYDSRTALRQHQL